MADDFPCDSRTNTPEFNDHYGDIKWDVDHDELGRVVKKDCPCRTWAGYWPTSWGKNSKGEEHHKGCDEYKT